MNNINSEEKTISKQRSTSLNILYSFQIFPINLEKELIIEKNIKKKNENLKKHNHKTKKLLSNKLFEQKKQMNKKIRNIETENSPDRHYYHNKNVERIWKELEKDNILSEKNKKKLLEEKKTKIKKYEKMRIRKKSIADNNEHLNKNNFNSDNINDENNDLLQKKKIITQEISKLFSKISIKTFLVIYFNISLIIILKVG